MLKIGEQPHILSDLRNAVEPNVAAVVDRLRAFAAANQPELRREAPVHIARAAEWILDNGPEIADVVAGSGVDLPYSREMILEGFQNVARRWLDVDGLTDLVREETRALRAVSPIYPEVVFINLAGNLFVSGWEAIVHAMLLGAACVVRCSESDRIFPAIWALALRRANPGRDAGVIVCEWSHKDFERFGAATSLADAVVCFGGNDSVQALRSITPWSTPFAGHGSTLSFSMVSADALRNTPIEWLAEQCAYDFAVYDQQGCLSPRALFLQDAHSRDVDRFVDALHSAMVKWEAVLPRRPLALEDASAIARARDEALLDAACGGAARRVSINSDPFLITVKPATHFCLGPVNRYLDIYLYQATADVAAVLADYRDRISTLAVADHKLAVPAELAWLRIRRVCEPGLMQRPPVDWCLDGLRPLEKMLRYQSQQAG